MITQKELKEIISYNKKTGEVTFKHKCNCEFCKFRKKIKNHKGYKSINIKGKKYLLHRIIWLYVYGKFPENVIDHINGIKDDNIITNLRDVKQEINCRNKKSSNRNKSGFVGVYFRKDRNKWIAQVGIKENGKRKVIHLGVFNTKNEAIQKRIEANLKYGFGENHGRL